MVIQMTADEFEKKLKQTNLSQNTIDSYMHTIHQFFSMYEDVTKKNLLSYKGFLIEKYKPKTVNLRILALNKYLEIINKGGLKLKLIKIQNKTFLENVISDAVAVTAVCISGGSNGCFVPVPVKLDDFCVFHCALLSLLCKDAFHLYTQQKSTGIAFVRNF